MINHTALARMVLATLVFGLWQQPARAEQAPAAAAMIRLLESGRVPPERRGNVVRMICQRGGPDELQKVLASVVNGGDWSPELRVQALGWLAEAARSRRVTPSGDLSALPVWVAESGSPYQRSAIELCGLWRINSAVPPLTDLVQNSKSPKEIRKQAVEALARLDRRKAVSLIQALAAADQPFEQRVSAVGLMIPVDANQGADLAGKLLANWPEDKELGAVLDPCLQLKNGESLLTQQLKKQRPSADVAKLALRHLRQAGRAEGELSQLLSDVAGIVQERGMPTPEEMSALINAVAQGNPSRGEDVFRRADLNCLSCHAINKGGNDIGPDLSSVGAISPPDFLISSILDPSLSIKEAYATRMVATADGKILQGIVVDRSEEVLQLKTATGETISIPIDEIDAEQPGQSLMPKGLTNLLTQTEFVDLVSFLASLGKPGENAVRTTPRFQRYRIWNGAGIGTMTFEHPLADPKWVPIWARANGDLPLNEVEKLVPRSPIVIAAEFECATGGPVQLQLDSAKGVEAWIDAKAVNLTKGTPVTVQPGLHRVVLRINRAERPESSVRMELSRPASSKAEVTVVDGR